jgi:hypothetical protein
MASVASFRRTKIVHMLNIILHFSKKSRDSHEACFFSAISSPLVILSQKHRFLAAILKLQKATGQPERQKQDPSVTNKEDTP